MSPRTAEGSYGKKRQSSRACRGVPWQKAPVIPSLPRGARGKAPLSPRACRGVPWQISASHPVLAGGSHGKKRQSSRACRGVPWQSASHPVPVEGSHRKNHAPCHHFVTSFLIIENSQIFRCFFVKYVYNSIKGQRKSKEELVGHVGS